STPPYEPFRSISINLSDAGSIDWYYRNAATYDFPAGTNISASGGLTAVSILVGTTTDICDTLALFREGEIPRGEQESFGMSQYRESEIDALLASPIPSGISGGLYAFLSAAYRSGFVNDKVQALLGQSSIEGLALTEEIYRQGNFDSALTVLNGLTPVNIEESLLRDVWSIRLSHAASDPNPDWTENEALSLRDIAYRDLEDAGSAAILAQSLLGLTTLPNDWIAVEFEERLASNLPDLNRIYPNPAQTIVFLDASTEPASAVLTDLQGQVLPVIRMEAESTVSVDISNLPQGLYLVQITKDSGLAVTYKLFINR
ncbi:MAG: T9SS type A sorting domain-containing protein, partial [Bacteroidetes bacterium]|nr:T9SS type A sorting domain-containing protein [Bacteroidota bacterium]